VIPAPGLRGRANGTSVTSSAAVNSKELAIGRGARLEPLALAGVTRPAARGQDGGGGARPRKLDLGPNEWPANSDFLLARIGASGELVDLTEDDIRLWMFWLGLDYILNR